MSLFVEVFFVGHWDPGLGGHRVIRRLPSDRPDPLVEQMEFCTRRAEATEAAELTGRQNDG